MAKDSAAPSNAKMKRKEYEKELRKLQVELCHLQDWMKAEGGRVIVVFEGRDAAGKGGTIKAITERVSPRVFRVVALPAPSDREKTQMFVQRYIAHFPAAGEIVIFDRSWYNRAGVENVMGFVPPSEVGRFLKLCPEIERYITDAGIILLKFWLEVGKEEQERRFLARINDPMRQWKLSPMDLESFRRWYDYSHARDRYRLCAVAHCQIRRQKTRAAQLHLGHAQAGPLQEGQDGKGEIAKAIEQGPLRRSSHDGRPQFCSRKILTNVLLRIRHRCTALKIVPKVSLIKETQAELRRILQAKDKIKWGAHGKIVIIGTNN